MSSRSAKIAALHARDMRRAEAVGLSSARTARGSKVQLSGTILNTMMLADLLGRNRTAMLVTKVRAFATSYDKRLTTIADRLGLKPEGLKALRARYARRSEKAADRMVRSLDRSTLNDLSDDEALRRAGLASRDDYQLRAVIRTHVTDAYHEGRITELKQSDAWDSLWGWEYSAVLDQRTSELCTDLDGVKRPRDDPFWSRYTPPNHYNCRSSLVEVFRDEGDGDDIDVDELDEPLELSITVEEA